MIGIVRFRNDWRGKTFGSGKNVDAVTGADHVAPPSVVFATWIVLVPSPLMMPEKYSVHAA